jgi:type IX secretion system PorP/SprF family membrane protein
MKKIFILAITIFQATCVFSQQLPEVSYYMYDYSRTNPGSLGSNDMVCASIIHKNSFMSFPGRPIDTYVNLEVPFNLFGAKHGAGVSLLNDNIGYYNNYHLRVGYAFRFPVGDGTLGVGFNGGFNKYSLTIDGGWRPAGSIIPDNDPNIPQATEGGGVNSFALSVGLFYRAEDIYFGASVLNAYASEVDYSSNATATAGSTAKEILRPHYYITSGYYLQLSNPAFELQPSINLYSDAATVTFDLNATLTYNKKMWGGVSYRAGSSAVGMIGLMILDGLKVGYAYDFQTSALNRYSNGSHEILLNYCFKIGTEKTPERYKSIRYL